MKRDKKVIGKGGQKETNNLHLGGGFKYSVAILAQVLAQGPSRGEAELAKPLKGSWGFLFAMEVFQSWGDLQYGDSWSGVLSTLVHYNNGDVLGTTVHRPARRVLIQGGKMEPTAEFLVLEAKVVQVSPLVICEVGDNGFVTPIPVCQAHHLHAVVELCSGMGLFSSMATVASLGVKLGVDLNPSWEGLFRELHPSADFVASEVGNMQVVRHMAGMDLFHPIIVAGISCQPHSRAGDQRGMQDNRSRSLPDVLRLMWFVQCPLGILECVPEIWQNAEAQKMLHDFCAATGYQLTQQVLHLSDFLPTRRSRWFAVLASPAIGFMTIPCQKRKNNNVLLM